MSSEAAPTPDATSANAAGATASTPAATNSAGDFVSREAYEALKKICDDQSAEIGRARAKVERTDHQNLQYIEKHREGIAGVINDVKATCSETESGYLSAMEAWASKLQETPASHLDKEMPIAVFACKASAGIKRSKEMEGQLEEKSKELQEAYKKLEDSNEQNAKLQRSLDDMQSLAVERQRNAEEMHKRYSQMVGSAKMYDFSSVANRESGSLSEAARRAESALGGNAIGEQVTTIAAKASAESASSSASTSNAAPAPVSGVSSLLSFIEANGRGDSRFRPSDNAQSPFSVNGEYMSALSGSSLVRDNASAVRSFLQGV